MITKETVYCGLHKLIYTRTIIAQFLGPNNHRSHLIWKIFKYKLICSIKIKNVKVYTTQLNIYIKVSKLESKKVSTTIVYVFIFDNLYKTHITTNWITSVTTLNPSDTNLFHCPFLFMIHLAPRATTCHRRTLLWKWHCVNWRSNNLIGCDVQKVFQ